MGSSISYLRATLLAGSVIFGAGVHTAAGAQDGDRDVQSSSPAEHPSTGVGEIIVTSQRYEQNLQDTPLSIVALDDEDLEARNVSNIADFDKFVPNVSIGGSQGVGDSIATFSIRGIGGAPAGFVTQEGAVGVYIDDVLFARPNGALLDLLDVERVEVLRGPQGTLFGRNTAGGAIRYVTKSPRFDSISGEAKVAIGTFDRMDVSNFLNLPLGETIAARISVAKKSRDGHIRRLIDDGDVGDQNATTGRIQFRVQPTDRLDVNLAADIIRTHNDGVGTIIGSVNGYPAYNFNDSYPNALYCAVGTPRCNPAVQAQARALAPLWVSPSGYADRDVDYAFYASQLTDGYTIYGGLRPDRNDFESYGLSAIAEYDINDDISIKSLTGYREIDQKIDMDQDRLPLPIFGMKEDIFIKYVSQEIQLTGSSFSDRLKWVGGAFYYWDKARDYRRRTGGSAPSNSRFADDGTLFSDPADGVGLGALEQKFITTESIALFGQGTLDLTDALSATVGLRWSRDRKDFQAFREDRGIVDGVSVPHRVKGDWSNVSPRFSLQYDWSPAVMTYVSASRGFKGGGFNDTTAGTCAAQDEEACGIEEFRPETLWTYETGLRADLFDRLARVNVTAFLTKYRDLQIQYTVTTPFPQQFTVNGNSTVKGFEGELFVVPVTGLTMRAAVGYTDSQYDDDVMDGGIVRIAKDAPYFRSPKWSYTLGASYVAPVSGNDEVAFDINWGWKDEMSSTATPANTVILPSYGLLNGRIEYRAGSGWSLALSGSNLLDKYYLVGAFDPSGPATKPTPGSTLPHATVFGYSMLDVGRPREVALELKYEF